MDFEEPKKHCETYAGFILHCEAKDATGKPAPQNPWHDFTSNNIEWKSESGSEVCIANGGRVGEMSWHKKSPDLNKLISTGARIIWARGKVSAVLIGFPRKGESTVTRF